MNEEENLSQPQQDLIDSLLQTVYRSDKNEAQDRVSAAMLEIDSLVEPVSRRQKGWAAKSKWIALATATVVLIAILLPIGGNQTPSALAVIRQSIEEASKDVARQYRLSLKYQTKRDWVISREMDLYVKGSDQVAVRRELPRGDLWYGRSDTKGWVVAQRGPIIEGDISKMERWLEQQENLSTPLLSLERMLKKMENGYDLEITDEETLVTAAGEIECVHVLAKWNLNAGGKQPDVIELWVDKETNSAQRVLLNWDRDSGNAGVKSIVLDLVDQSELADDWFLADGHIDGPRRRIRFDAEERP